jgi:hypothetical protein
VDTAAEKLTETVARQKLTASETTHDNEYRIHAVTAKKHRKRVSRQKNLARPLFLFLIWVRRVLRSVITVYVPLFFYSFFCATCIVQSTCSIRPLFLNQSSLNRLRPAGAGGQTGSVVGRALPIASAPTRARPQSTSGVRRAERSFPFCLYTERAK